MSFGVLSAVGQLVRRMVAIGVLFGVLVAPAEALIPDVHEPGTELAAARLAPVLRAHASNTVADRAAASANGVQSQHACPAGAHSDGCAPDRSGTAGYDHCAHSHVAGLARTELRATRRATQYAVYRQPIPLPASFRAAPDIRPPIA